jgi:hypothetical protein
LTAFIVEDRTLGPMLVALVLIPLILIGIVALMAAISISRSSVRITSDGVQINNYRQPPRTIPLAQADHFESPEPVGYMQFLRPPTAVLVCKDGTRLPVRSISEVEAGRGVPALNARLDQLRGG